MILRRVVVPGTLALGLSLSLASGMGVLTQSLTFGNPSYEYRCVPIIDGEERETIEPTSNRTFTVDSGEHQLNAKFLKSDGEIEVGTARTVHVDQATSVACYSFME